MSTNSKQRVKARPLDRRLLFLIARAERKIARLLDQQLRDLHIRASQLAVLLYVVEREGCTLTELSTALDLDNSAVTRLIERMEQVDLVRRHVSPDDARARAVYSLVSGRRVAERAAPAIHMVTDMVTRDVAASDVEAALRLLNAVVVETR